MIIVIYGYNIYIFIINFIVNKLAELFDRFLDASSYLEAVFFLDSFPISLSLHLNLLFLLLYLLLSEVECIRGYRHTHIPSMPVSV